MFETDTDGKPSYRCADLRARLTRVAIVQSIVRPIEAANPVPGKRANVDHMLALIDAAHGSAGGAWYGKPDLVAFHEFPISGWRGFWRRDDLLAVAIDVPGEETAALGRKAKERNCYVAFGCYAKEPDWPRHFINMGVIVGPDGEVVLKSWRRFNKSGVGFSSTVNDVLDRYVERYGWDAVFRVARTPIGNLAFASDPIEPDMPRALAIKGAEIVIRYMTAGGGPLIRMEFQVQCFQNGVYGLYTNQAVSPNEVLADINAGGSAIFDPHGNVLAEASGHHETVVYATISIADFRRNHTIPAVAQEVYARVYDQYVPRYPAGSFLDDMPEDLAASVGFFRSRARW